jgi:predicted nucleotidyltransferase
VRAAELAYAFQEAGRLCRGEPPRPDGGGVMFDPAAILKQLLDGKVEFVLIGGLAMTIHGSAYVTRDVDVCYRRTSENIAAVAAALTPVHPYLRGAPAGLPFAFDAKTIQAGLNFTLTTDLGDLDLLGEVSGIGNDQKVFALSEEKTIFGMKVRVLSLDGLIAAKRAAGRGKDRDHLLELEELKKMKDVAAEEGPGTSAVPPAEK